MREQGNADSVQDGGEVEGSAGFYVSTAAMSSSRGGVWRSASSNTTEGSVGVSVSTAAMNSSRGGVWWSASSSTMEGPADFSPSTGILGVGGFAAFELRLRLPRFITIQFYPKDWRRN